MASRTGSVIANPTEYSTLRPRTLSCSVEPVQQLVGCARAVGADQQLPAVGGGDLGDRRGQHLDVVGGGVRPGVPGAAASAARNSLVLSHHTPSGWNPKVPLNVGAAVPFSLCAITIVASTSSTTTSPRSVPATRRGRHTARQLRPDAAADPSPRGLAILLSRAGGDLVQRAPHRRRRRDRTQHGALVAQHVDVGDRLTAVGDHDRHVGQHPAPVMTGDELAPRQRRRQLPMSGRPGRPAAEAATLPAWATTPVPSPVTDNPADHEVRFTYGVPSSLATLDLRKPKYPMQDRHFRASTRRQTPSTMNEPG